MFAPNSPLGSLPPSAGEDRPAVIVTAMLVTVGRPLSMGRA
jgi:hypothetical protein